MFIGIDLGSRFVKLVYGGDTGSVSCLRFSTVDFYKRYCVKEFGKFLLNIKELGPDFEDITNIVATGYGKNIVRFEGIKTITEIEAHVIGAKNSFDSEDFTVLDIGGQDSKVIYVEDGVIKNFFMNEKCAAGSGRYLENMARLLDIDIKDIGNYYKDPALLSNTCAIFGESEVISHIVDGIDLENIASGVNYSVFNRLRPELLRSNTDTIIFVGGLSRNEALIHYIKRYLNKIVVVPKNPEYNGAFGAFIWGQEMERRFL